MASSFRRDTPVLNLRSRSPVRFRERRYLLWPAWLYRVVAPEVRERQLNVLQKAVLGLCRAGVRTAERIGESLRIHADLATLICVELQERRLLGSTRIPTQEGLDVFEDETVTSHRIVTGHVFQDPWSGELWPRFFQRIDHAEVEMGASGYPSLILGTKGKPRRERAYMHLPGDPAIPEPPEPRDILLATRRHRVALRGSGQVDAEDEDRPLDEDRPSREGGALLDRISLVDDRPSPVFVVTFIYLPESVDVDGGWHVCDPFGPGASPRLRRSLERAFGQSAGLRSLVEGMLGQSLEAQVDDQHRWAADLRQRAELNVQGKLASAVRGLPHHEDLIELEQARIEVELLGEQCPAYKLQGLLAAGRRALEASFRVIADRHPPRDVWTFVYAGNRPNEDQSYVSNVYEGAARAVGFATPLPPSLLGVKPNMVKAACYRDGWRLRGAILAAVLAARRDTAHPLHRAARREPRLLALLDGVAHEAGEAVHAGDSPPSPKRALSVTEQVLQLVGILFDMGPKRQAQTVVRSS